MAGGSIPAAIWKDVMEPTQAGLSNLPLPGDNDPIMTAPAVRWPPTPKSIPDAGADQEYLPRQRKRRGFFESLFGSTP